MARRATSGSEPKPLSVGVIHCRAPRGVGFWEAMAEDLELWREPSEPRYLFDRPPAFGLARDAERMRQGIPPAPRRPSGRRYRPPRRFIGLPWSSRDGGAGELWHRMRCRRGHHEVSGGHTMQLGSDAVFIERRCRWCGAKPG